MFCKRIVLLCLSIFIFLSGCNSPVYNQAESNVADVAQRNEDAKANMAERVKPSPTLLVNQGLYVDRTPISLARAPTWLKNRIVIRGDQLPFSYYSRTILNGGGPHILTHYQGGLDEKALISMNYSGTIQGALDLLASKTGFVFTVNCNDVYWQAFMTKTYDIAFMPGSSDYMMGKNSGNSSSNSSSGATNTVTGTLDDSAGQQYSALKGTLSVWKDLEAAIKQLLSPEGKVMVSEATTSVTVRDRPPNIALVTRFIANFNDNLSKQVLVKIQVLQVTLENDFNYGINWNAVEGSFGGGTYQLVSNNGTPISITSSITQLSNSLAQVGLNNPDMLSGARLTGVIALINALKQQGKVSLVTEPRVLCQNNQVSVIRLVDQQGYLASVQTTSLAGGTGTGSSITSQITPGAVVTGLTLYVLPKILGNKVFLQVNADLSTFVGLTTVTSNGATLTTTTTPPAGTSIIQVPHVQQKQFNQRSVINSGDTLIMAGFRQVGNSVGASQLFESQALGGKTAIQTNTETIVLITPLILPPGKV